MVRKSVGDIDGYGRYGVLAIVDGLLECHDCGWLGEHLGLHAYRAHGMTAREYRTVHGLKRSTGLIAPELRERMSAIRVANPNPLLAATRDPAKATQARLAQGSPVSAAAAADRDARMAAAGPGRRLGIVVTCGWCGSQFCPLKGARRRRYCSRSCASTANRARASGRQAR